MSSSSWASTCSAASTEATTIATAAITRNRLIIFLSLCRYRECGGLDFARSLKLKPPAVDSGLRESREKRDPALAVFRVALVRMAVNERRGVLMDQYEVRDRSQPRLKVAD